MVIVEDDVGCTDDIEGDDEQPKERTYPYRKKRQDGEHSSCEVAVGGERGETSGQIGTDDAWKDKDEPEEAKTVQGRDDAVRFDPVHRLEPGQEYTLKQSSHAT